VYDYKQKKIRFNKMLLIKVL